MTNEPKIVVIGAGSTNFCFVTLNDILSDPKLQNASLYMVDINEETLNLVASLAKVIKEQYKSKIELFAETDRRKVLENSDFVILSIGVEREQTWQMDFKIAKKFGIWHYAENGGPGSFGHTARNLAVIMPILNDIHDFSPDSWLLNFTNPLSRIHYAAKDYANINCISFCHQYWNGFYILGRILANDLGIKKDQNLGYHEYRNLALSEYNILAAGLNHFTWMLEVRRRSNGENLYPLIHLNIDNVPPSYEALTRHIFRIFKLLPVPGETHLSEYLPYTAQKEHWDKYNLYHFDFNENLRNKAKNWQTIKNIINGKIGVDVLQLDPAERIAHLITEIYTDSSFYEPALNIENNGAIRNLPMDSVVEVPCVVNKRGGLGVSVGRLPESIAALCHREISISKLITKASVNGDIEAGIQAFALFPMINDLNLAETLFYEYLEKFKKSLPQFNDK
ncbi:MAG: hypothetical protein JSW11_18065 [Candidatus Heimdallarchaeota archaeon]|nr:MAG: hypothetical protein JSW11_18065 [Candidatus Heimdallarchaeota archaeon]